MARISTAVARASDLVTGCQKKSRYTMVRQILNCDAMLGRTVLKQAKIYTANWNATSECGEELAAPKATLEDVCEC